MACSVSRDLMQPQRTDGRWNTKKSYWNQNYQDTEGVSIGQKNTSKEMSLHPTETIIKRFL